jgi:branched-chain amino acid transport system permease protein
VTAPAATGRAEGGRLAARWRTDWLALAIFAALALVPFAVRLGAEGYLLSLATRTIILALAAVSLDLILGFGGLISFGHAAIVGLGAYVTGILLTEGISETALVLPAACFACALFALATGAVSLRTSGVYFIMITLAFGQMLYFTASSLSAYGGDDGLTLWSRATLFGTDVLEDDTALYYAAFAALLGGYLLCRVLVASRFGRVLRAARENPTRTASLGFDVFRTRLAAYVIAAVLAGVAGFLLANQSEFVSPRTLSWQASGELIVMVVLGGIGSLHGAILGAAAYVLLEELLSDVTEHWRLIFGPFLILVVLFARGGLAGILRGGRAG